MVAARPVRRTRTSALRALLLLPAIVYLALLTQAPFILTLWYSVHKWITTEPELGRPFVGFANFGEAIAHDAVFRESVVNLVAVTAGIIVPSLVIGLAFALLLNRRFPARGFVRALFIAPFFVMPTVNAVVWKNLILNPVYGLVAALANALHLGTFDIFASAPKLGIIAIATWQWTPFMMLILLAGLQSLPQDVHEAAVVDGAGPWNEFRFITLPLLAPYVELALLLGSIYVLQLFAEIFVATQGGPGDSTTTLPFYIYQLISQDNDVGMASAQAVLAVVLASVIAALLLRLMARTFARASSSGA